MAEQIVFREHIHTFQIDFNRHVSNIVYVQWMEVGRLRLLEAVGLPIHEIDRAGFLPVLVETQITYRRPLLMGDTVEIALWVSELTPLWAWITFRFRNDRGEEVARGRQKGLFVRTDTNRPKRLTEAERSVFTRFLATEPEP